MCARFLSHLLLLYIGRVHEAISGCIIPLLYSIEKMRNTGAKKEKFLKLDFL